MAEHRDYKTAYGVIHYGPEQCRDDYPNFVVYDQGGSSVVLTLQRPAMEAFQAAEVRVAKRLGWSDERIKKNHGHGRAISVLAGTNRTCATQARLYASDSNRYAAPNSTGHTRGIAIDVNQAQEHLDLINTALYAEGWRRARPGEPWHWSFGPIV